MNIIVRQLCRDSTDLSYEAHRTPKLCIIASFFVHLASLESDTKQRYAMQFSCQICHFFKLSSLKFGTGNIFLHNFFAYPKQYALVEILKQVCTCYQVLPSTLFLPELQIVYSMCYKIIEIPEDNTLPIYCGLTYT